MARASWTAIACPRARARDERVARGRRVNRLGRVWRSLVSGCHGVVVVTALPSQAYWGGCGGTWCQYVTESWWSQRYRHRRIEEGVAVIGAQMSRSRVGHALSADAHERPASTWRDPSAASSLTGPRGEQATQTTLSRGGASHSRRVHRGRLSTHSGGGRGIVYNRSVGSTGSVQIS